MRLWTVHPRYLDVKGLTAAWREALLAQKVLKGETRGYTRHPQLTRFRGHRRPLEAIAAYLHGIAREAQRRGYRFDVSRISNRGLKARMSESRDQLLYEWEHLRAKLRVRAPQLYRQLEAVAVPRAHPLFRIHSGAIGEWENLRSAGVRTSGGPTSTAFPIFVKSVLGANAEPCRSSRRAAKRTTNKHE